MNKYYAGIGSRETPKDILELMTKIAKNLNNQGYILRSGGAIGADTAFEIGVSNKEIFRANDATPEAIKIAMELHPNPKACKPYVRKLHGRNAQIVLGYNLDALVEFVIVWTPNGKLSGGSAMGMRIAKKFHIPVYNLAIQEDTDALYKRILK